MNVGDGGISANDGGHDLKRRDLEIIAGMIADGSRDRKSVV